MSLLPFLLLLLLHSATLTSAQPLLSKCGGTNFTAHSPYLTNLTTLLGYFTSLNSTTFATHASGSAYGLFLCRGDVSTSDCSNCIHGAAQDVRSLCPNSKQAAVWYDYCQLVYSDTRFFGSPDTSAPGVLINVQNATDQADFLQLQKALFSNITSQAALVSPDMFATGSATNGSLTANGLVQCTRDLSRDECDQCLNQIEGEYWGSNLGIKQGGRALTKSCNFRYEKYPFFNGKPVVSLNLTPPSPPPPPSRPLLPPPSTISTPDTGSSNNHTAIILAIVIPTVAVLMLMLALLIYFWRKRPAQTMTSVTNLEDISTIDSIMFELSVLRAATENFSEANKLGEGGFGSVYKGTLSDGKEIAVKRLAVGSTQGIEELRNEFFLVAKLQHRNLVRLRGICLEEEEKLLVYEYVPNRSLDNFLFDAAKCKELNWARRFNIIGGIARGLFYLHEESHLKIVHRDLKASNILLDEDMNPKVSDFGLAKLFGGDETQGMTSRIVGTFGYMAPEYALYGQFSTKADVYSFGILALEIVTGRKNSSFLGAERNQDFLSYVWEHWSSGTVLEITDPHMDEPSCSRSEVVRCIHIALLCIQESPAERPPMSTVVLMLHSPSVPLGDPMQPRSVPMSKLVKPDTSANRKDPSSGSTNQTVASVNEASITDLDPR